MSKARQTKTLALILAMFLAMLAIMLIPMSMRLGIIQDKTLIRSEDIELTTGDTLAIFSLFGTCVTIGVWAAATRKKIRR